MYARSGNRLHSVQPCLSPRALRGASSMASCLSSDERVQRSVVIVALQDFVTSFLWQCAYTTSPESRERCRDAQTCLQSQKTGELEKCPEVRGRGLALSLARGPDIEESCRSQTFTTFGRASRRTHEPDRQCSGRNRSCNNALFPYCRSLSATFRSLSRGSLRSLDLV